MLWPEGLFLPILMNYKKETLLGFIFKPIALIIVGTGILLGVALGILVPLHLIGVV